MKRILTICLLFVTVLNCLVLAACALIPSLPDAEISIVTTNFAAYDFASSIVGEDRERVSVEFLSAGDSHSFNPTYGDVTKIENADLFIYVGGESDHAIEQMLTNVKNTAKFKMIDCVELLSVDGADDHHDHEYDEHVWTTPYHAALIVQSLCDTLCEIDPEYAEVYRENTATYKAALEKLDADFTALFALYDNPTLVVGDRFPFLYFAERYGISYHAAFPSCSSASEPSPKRVLELVEFVKENKISTVFHMESGNHSVADRIAKESGTVTALLHSCHKVTPDEIRAGTTYLSLMQANYLAIQKALDS